MDEDAAHPRPGPFSNADERIYALLAVVEDQQNAVHAGLQGMAQERAALATERVALIKQAERMERLSDKLSGSLLQAIPNVTESAGKAAATRVAQLLHGTVAVAVQTAAEAAQPTLDSIKEAVSSATAAQLELRRAVKDFRKQWLWVVAVLLGTVLIVSAVMGYLAVLWQREELAKAIAARDKLTVEMNALQEQVEQGKRNNGRKPGK